MFGNLAQPFGRLGKCIEYRESILVDMGTMDVRLQSALDELSEMISSNTPRDGNFELGNSGVTLLRRSEPSEKIRGWQPISVCVVARGAKRLTLGSQIWDCDEARVMACSMDVPVVSQILRASGQDPFLCVRLKIDPQTMSSLMVRAVPAGSFKDRGKPVFGVAPTDPRLLGSVSRLVEAFANPAEGGLYASLAYEEFLLRLLRGPAGAVVAQMSLTESGLAGVSRAVAWMRQHYASPVKMTDLAQLAHMSVSTFHEHFKEVTGLSPLQYLKAIRLQEARNLMLTRVVGAKSASQKVGYASPSQFSREYSRYFGRSPLADIELTRERLIGAPRTAAQP